MNTANTKCSPAVLQLIVQAEVHNVAMNLLDTQLNELKVVLEDKADIAKEALDHLTKCRDQLGAEHQATQEAYRRAKAYHNEMKAASAQWSKLVTQYEELLASYITTNGLIKIMTA